MDTVDPKKLQTLQEMVASLSPELQANHTYLQENPGMIPTPESLKLFVIKEDYERAQSEFIEKIEYTPLKDAIDVWLTNLSPDTARNYRYYINDMKKMWLFPDYDANQNVYTVGHFNHTNHVEVIDWIKKVPENIWKESTRQTHAACYISLTAYLERWSKGWFKKAIPNVSSQNKTFYQVRDKCATDALTLAQWHRFIEKLHDINERDSLIARCMFQGAKRISEVLSVTLDQIDWEKNIIQYKQSKTGGMLKIIPITYPQHFMDELKSYIESTSPKRTKNSFVFITRTGEAVTRMRLNYSFVKATTKANLVRIIECPKNPKKKKEKYISPHMLRATWVTLVKQQGIQDTEIMKVTGHTSSKMIYQYDKTSAEENVSKKLVLI